MADAGSQEGFKPGDVAFGSGVERLMFPVHTAPTRLGIEQGLRGEPHRGPGCYSPDPLSLFLKPLDSTPRSKRGWYFGANRASRATALGKGDNPGPSQYQRIGPTKFAENDKPFNAISQRWTDHDRNAEKPGPGTYNLGVPESRHVEFDEAFGRSRILHNAVTVKCTKGIPDKCGLCKEEMMGDYFQKGESILCSKCHKKCQATKPSHNRDLQTQYEKVRDCRGVHQHKFPGKDPKIILKSESELRRQRHREAYLRLYFSD